MSDLSEMENRTLKNRAGPAQRYTLNAALLTAMLIGGISVGFALPWVSSLVDGRLYHDPDEIWGLGDDMFGALIPIIWHAYSALYGAVLGVLSVVSVRHNRAWMGLLWIAASALFYAVMPAGEPSFLPFQIFRIAPTWLCGVVLVLGLVLSAVWLTQGTPGGDGAEAIKARDRKARDRKAKQIAARIIASAVLLLVVISAVQAAERVVQVRQDQALVSAAAKGDTKELARLLKQGGNVNATSFDNNSGLWTAVSNRQVSTIGLLLSRGANPETASELGQSPLECAIENLNNDSGTAEAKADVAIIHLLLSYGASRAKVKQDAETVALLKRSGIKI